MKIISLLTTLSNFNKNKELIFVNKSTVSINTNLDANKLDDNLIKHLSSAAIEEAITSLELWVEREDDVHLYQKKSIFASQIFELEGSSELGNDFLSVLIRFAKLVNNSLTSYQLYLEDFSFSLFEKKLEERSLEYYEKIAKSVLDVRNQVLGLPIAFILVSFVRGASSTVV